MEVLSRQLCAVLGRPTEMAANGERSGRVVVGGGGVHLSLSVSGTPGGAALAWWRLQTDGV